MKELTIKEIHVARKNGEGFTQIAEKFGMTPEQVRSFIKENVSSSNVVTQLINSLEKNEKALKRANRKAEKKHDEVSNEQVEDNFEELTTTEQTEELMSNEDSYETEMSVEAQKPAKLDELLEEESKLSVNCMDLEVQHNALVSRRRELVSNIRDIGEKLSSIQQEAKVLRDELISSYMEYDDVAKEMAKLNPEISANKELLEEIRAEIAELSKVVIVVYTDGKIEAENTEIPEVSDGCITEILAELLEKPKAEELTLRALKSIVRLHFILNVLDGQGVKYDLGFESEVTKELFEEVHNS